MWVSLKKMVSGEDLFRSYSQFVHDTHTHIYIVLHLVPSDNEEKQMTGPYLVLSTRLALL